MIPFGEIRVFQAADHIASVLVEASLLLSIKVGDLGPPSKDSPGV